MQEFREFFEANRDFLIQLFLEHPELIKCGIIQSFTTKHMCKEYNICEKSDYSTESERIPTNPEEGFENFFQTIYHAGNIKQFFTYARIDTHLIQVSTTMHYLFDVLKKGIYIRDKIWNIACIFTI